MIDTFSTQLIELLKHYYFVGGMPEVVKTYLLQKDFSLVREIQKSILLAYEQDFSKHAPFSIVPRIRMVWQSIPSQLAKENKKFIYGLLKEGARAKEYEAALLWLYDCGLVQMLYRAKTPKIPLKAYEDIKAFKLFTLDIGLLTCMAGVHQQILLQGNDLFTEFKGALAEQFVMQELHTINMAAWYWTNETSSAEIDFLLDTGTAIIPLEVKAQTNLQAKSLKSYREKFSPPLAIRASLAPYKKEEGLVNLPLYALATLKTIVQ